MTKVIVLLELVPELFMNMTDEDSNYEPLDTLVNQLDGQCLKSFNKVEFVLLAKNSIHLMVMDTVKKWFNFIKRRLLSSYPFLADLESKKWLQIMSVGEGILYVSGQEDCCLYASPEFFALYNRTRKYLNIFYPTRMRGHFDFFPLGNSHLINHDFKKNFVFHRRMSIFFLFATTPFLIVSLAIFFYNPNFATTLILLLIGVSLWTQFSSGRDKLKNL